MALLSTYDGNVYADLVGASDDSRYLRGLNITWYDADTGVAVEVDSVYLTITDANDTEQYLLSTVTTPAVVLEQPGLRYTIESVDVSNFPSGDISLTWTGTLDGYSYTSVQTINYDTAPDMVFVSGQTTSLGDFKCILNQAKTFTIRIVDGIGIPVATNAVRGIFYDRYLGTTDTQNAALASVGSGVWSFSYTLSSTTYVADLNRYEIYWQVQLIDGDVWLEVHNARYSLEVYGSPAAVTTGGLTYSSNQTIRETFPDLDSLLSELNPNQAEREILLNRARYEASVLLANDLTGSTVKFNRDILELLEIYEAYRIILLKARGFAKFGVADGQLKEINNMIKRIKTSLYAPVSTMRIGRRG